MNLLHDDIVNLSAATVDALSLTLLNEQQLRVDVLRLDKIDDFISGNKWFKLKYYLEEAIANKCASIFTFGGAYSNHIIATACAASRCGLRSIGIIRGERPAVLSHTLIDAMKFGMELQFISRDQYSNRNNPAFIEELSIKFEGAYCIAEGGQGLPGIRGASEITELFERRLYTHIICAVGTGTLLEGLSFHLLPSQQLLGIPVLKGLNELEKKWSAATESNVHDQIKLIPHYHFGGYAKNNNQLFSFMNELYLHTGIPTDFVYTGKIFFGTIDLIKKGYFPKESRLLIIHSGGLQGNGSLEQGTLIF